MYRTGERMAGCFPARTVTGGGGPAGEKDEGSEGYLWVCSARREMAGGGLTAEEQGRRWWCPAAAALR